MSKTLEQSFFETLNEKQKRLFAGLKANQLGYFGVNQVQPNLDFIHIPFGRGKKNQLKFPKTRELPRGFAKSAADEKKS